MSDFIHLHCHTEYSMLDGAIRLKDLCQKAKDYGMGACAVTDHGNMFAAASFQKACTEFGIKPIFGCEVYTCRDHLDTKSEDAKRRNHLILLAKNMTGYHNLVKVVTKGWLEGFFYKPRVDWNILKEYSEGIICLTACIQGEIPQAILSGDMDKAREITRQYAALYKDNFYLELQHNGLEKQTIVNNGLLELAESEHLPVVATNDCHYLNADDYEAHEILLCIGTGSTINDKKRFRFETHELYYKSPEEMERDFASVPQAIENTAKIAEMCNCELTFGKHFFPKYPLPEGASLESEFRKLAEEGLERRFRDTSSSWIKEEIESYMSAVPCDACGGKRLSKESLAVTVGGKNISDFCDLSVVDALAFLDTLTLTPREEMIAAAVLKEIRSRLGFLRNVGLEYLTLSRAAATLSGGESQRIRLATNIGSSLMGVLYILDEPSIGLHQRDNHKLLSTLMRLRDLGNTVIVVEHDEDTMLAADHIVDIGPGAGIHGGNVIYSGDVQGILKCPESITGQYLSGQRFIPVPQTRREGNGKKITIVGAQQNNLKNVTVDIPLGKLVCITGVSGSGKSSLINEVLYKRLAGELNGARTVPGKHKEIRGMENLDKVIQINQSPIGRTPRSNPATYTGVFTDIRELYASTPEAKMHGFTSGRFSFNIKGGRCEACQGDGIIKIEMHFLPDVYVACDVCKGKRYNRETLEVKYKGKSIYDVLEMTVEEGLAFFKDHPKIARKLHTLCDVGLGYIKIGQPATTLSGGEAQRVKLATELSRRPTGKTVYILDEPTTGLHIADVHKLVEVLQKLVDGGNTVIVIEHNLDLIKCADHIIDLGPEGGSAGGLVIAEGTPEQVAEVPGSFTGQYLKPLLEKDKVLRQAAQQ